MSLHTVYLPDLLSHESIITITGEEAHHAVRVKRLMVGNNIGFANGQGRRVVAEIQAIDKTRDGWVVRAQPREILDVARPEPRLAVYAAAPKGDRLEHMIDGLSQVGAMSWSPLVSRRTVVEPREQKLERLERIAVEGLKQCGASWLLEIRPATTFSEAIKLPGLVLADASGEPWSGLTPSVATLLIGPEGGWTSEELDLARGAGARIAKFGGFILRTEVATVVAAAALMM